MTVRELIKELSKINKDREVLLSGDPEGNTKWLFDGLELAAYRNDGGELSTGLERLTPSLEKRGYTADDVVENGKPCVVLYPEHP